MTPPKPTLRRYVPAVGPRLQKLLWLCLGLFALTGVNAVYLSSVTILEWASGATYQNYFYIVMFLAHLVLGLLLVVPVIVFGAIHIKNAHGRRNRRAVRAGYALFATTLVLLGSGVALMRVGDFDLANPTARSAAYWAHVVAPLVCIWLFILHRLAGRRIRWRIGVAWASVTAVVAIGMALLHSQDPRRWNVEGPESGARYFFPSLARTATGDFIPAETLMMDSYCAECHEQAHADWSLSAHRFASFNNPAYLASVRETREVALERDGDVQAARFCAGCHDLVPFFSGAFDDPDFDDVNHPTSQAGITCTSCHAITHVNSPRGNSDFTIEEPIHYPFAFSDNELLGWINRQLVKAKPALHKKTFLKPLHKTAEFCGGCHKVHLPEELNHYKWLRGQNHYDSYLLSGVSGHGVQSFYYPPKAELSCNGCHMPLVPSGEFAAKDFDGLPGREVHGHLFPSANTAIASFAGTTAEEQAAHFAAHEEFTKGVMRVDLFALRRGPEIDSPLVAPLRPEAPVLQPGETVLIDAVIRTVKMGHMFTEGTADSNEAWLELTITDDAGNVLGKSGGMQPEGDVDPWSHFVRAYVLDRDGNRINRRNAQDIFIPLYSHQIPPGAGDVVHYRFTVPADVRGAIHVAARLRYRKFDTEYVRIYEGDAFRRNELPILELASDRVSLAVGDGAAGEPAAAPAPEWMRWNDYGIGLFRKGDSGSNRGELRQAEVAWQRVEALGRWDGPLNLARLYEKEGRLAEAVDALGRAQRHPPVDGVPAPFWTVSWFTGLVNKENGNLDDALQSFLAIAEADTAETRARRFDFSLDYNLLNEIGETLFEIAKRERGEANATGREETLVAAVGWFERALELDPENLTAHYNLAQVYGRLGDAERAAFHLAQHARYRPDDNARDRAVQAARAKDPAASHAADAIVIYDLQRPGAFELPAGKERR
jgi:tetratricopeptide (TPR) repeat protein